ncbi:hypothetical protein J2S74_000132 [Evansella vedderi]|uniref:IDEAL domain-containing protein n=1 Tax=Evansella vedderi TaxID=38282 RepID=A0ABT9ZRG7_9BACI|nr:hypothetical protein [Evansella vedderi]MDQ0252760.1 hypothetical protein [Evansella vedderi]
MSTYFIVFNADGLKLACLYYGNKKDNAIRNIEETKQGDIFEIMDVGKFIVGMGWYILVTINNKQSVFASIRDLEEAMESKKIQPLVDLELEHCYLKYQIDRALESKNKELFMNVIKRYKDFTILKEKSSSMLFNI